MNQKIKLIATDMDGTFVDDNKKFSPEFYDIFKQLKEKNILFCAASGRQYASLYQEFLPISDDMLFIAENGACIAKGKNILKSFSISPDSLKQIIDGLSKLSPLKFILCGQNKAYTLNENKYLEYEIKKYYYAYQFIDDYSCIKEPIIKIAIFDPEYKIYRFINDFKRITPDDCNFFTSGFEWTDITTKGVHKGRSILYLQEYLHLSKDQCAAFGDNMNDYSLLENVTYSYAMDNAVEAIKEMAYEVIGSNNDQAVITKIKEILK